MELLGAGAFGFVLGWNLYFVNRYRADKIGLSNVATLVSILGGGAVIALFPQGTPLFGAYGIGLASGFLAYFAMLVIMVAISKDFDVDWFLDGRRKKLGPNQEIPEGARETGAAMNRPNEEVP